jgi:hypothetical protein
MDRKALADAYIEFQSSRTYELKRSMFIGSLRTTKTDRIVINNEISNYINLDSLCEMKLNRSQSTVESHEITDKQELNVSKNAISEHIVAVMVVTALFFLMEQVLGDPVALVTAFMIVVWYFVFNIDLAIK